MKILISIAMSFLFLFQGVAVNMEVCEQLEQLAHFIEHYQEHKELDDYSFLEYVYADYINEDGNPDDHHQDAEHDETPVHSGNQCCHHIAFFTPFQPSLVNAVVNDAQEQFNQYAFRLNSRYLESLFQPPRV